MGDSSELVVLWESEEGLALFRFLLVVVLVVLVVVPVGVLQVGVGRMSASAVSVVYEGDARAVRT